MKSLLITLLLFVSAFSSQDSKPVAGDTAQLAWLSGTWTGTMNGMVIEEQWMHPEGGSVTGTNRMTRDGKQLKILNLVIVQKGPTLIYTSSKAGAKPPRPFALTEIRPKSVTFENETLGRVRYTLQADGTLELLGGEPGDKPMIVLLKKQ